MVTVLIVIHLLVVIALIGVILVQRSEGGGLGMGSSGGMGGLMSGRGTANLLTRTTAILTAVFMLSSLVLAYIAEQQSKPSSILDEPLSAEENDKTLEGFDFGDAAKAPAADSGDKAGEAAPPQTQPSVPLDK